MIFRATTILIILAAISGCDFVWSTEDICDCRFQPVRVEQEWQPLDKVPANYNRTEIRRLFDNGDPVYGTPEIFDSANIHWYRNNSGEAAACVVFESSTRMNASFTLSADQSEADPIDFRILGGHGPNRFFWLGCPEFGAPETEQIQ